MAEERTKNWRMLLRDRCPICECPLITKNKGFACSANHRWSDHPCGFFITKKRFDEMVKEMKDRRPRTHYS